VPRFRIFLSSNGIVFSNGSKNVIADPAGSGSEIVPDVILISHAHTDHVSGLSDIYRPGIPVIMSPETYRLIRLNGYKLRSSDIILLSPGENIILNGIEFLARHAGHVIGSLMFEIDFGNIRIGYTGDFNFESSVIMRRADILDCDFLVIDATYGTPKYSFPPRRILYRLIRKKLREARDEGYVVSLHGYALGKAQELTRLAWEFLGGSISVEKKVGIYNRIFEESSGIVLGPYTIGGLGDSFIRDISSPQAPRSKRFIFTGWAATRKFDNAIAFPLSAHSGFLTLVDFVERIDPQGVIVAYGFTSFFSKYLRRELDIPSYPIPLIPRELEFNPIKTADRRLNKNHFY